MSTGMPVFNALVSGEPLNSVFQNFGLEKLETPLYRTARKIFRYFESFRHDARV